MALIIRSNNPFFHMCVCSESMKAKPLTSPRFQSVKVQIHSIEILRSCVNFSSVPAAEITCRAAIPCDKSPIN